MGKLRKWEEDYRSQVQVAASMQEVADQRKTHRREQKCLAVKAAGSEDNDSDSDYEDRFGKPTIRTEMQPAQAVPYTHLRAHENP